MMKILTLLLLFLPLTACGPIYGELNELADSVEIKVVSGKLKELQPGGNLLVVGPFTKEKDAYYICRGEEAETFASRLNKEKLFASEFLYSDDYKTLGDRLRKKNGQDLQAELNLSQAPDFLLLGNIRYRQMHVIPVRGVVMPVGYTLEFIDLKTGKSTIVAIDVTDEIAKCIDAAVVELAKKLREAG